MDMRWSGRGMPPHAAARASMNVIQGRRRNLMFRLFCPISSICVLASCAVEPVEPSDLVDLEPPAVISQAVLPTTVYNLAGRTSPATAATAVNIDTRLTMTFDGPPVLGSGTVQI